MSYPYLKLFTEARNDAKLRSLTDAQFRCWFNLLCFASEQNKRGKIAGLSPFRVAVEVCNGDENLLVSTCNALQALQSVSWSFCVTGDIEIAFLKFEKRQYYKPSDRPENVKARVVKHRANKRSVNGRESVTPVTPMKRDETPRNAQEVEEEVEEENTPLTPPHGGSSSRSRSRLGKKERQEQIVAENVRIALDGLFSKPQPKPAEGSGDARL